MAREMTGTAGHYRGWHSIYCFILSQKYRIIQCPKICIYGNYYWFIIKMSTMFFLLLMTKIRWPLETCLSFSCRKFNPCSSRTFSESLRPLRPQTLSCSDFLILTMSYFQFWVLQLFLCLCPGINSNMKLNSLSWFSLRRTKKHKINVYVWDLLKIQRNFLPQQRRCFLRLFCLSCYRVDI